VADVRAEEITQRRQMIWESMKHTVEKTITKAAFHSVDDLVWVRAIVHVYALLCAKNDSSSD
jgi:hypothetical protein